RIGVRDRAIPIEARTMPPEATVDVLVGDADFDALCSALLPERSIEETRQAAKRPQAFDIYRNTASGLGVLRVMRPWFLTIFFLCIVGPIGGLTIGDSPVGRAVLTMITVAAIGAGLFATVRASSRPPSPHRLEVAKESLVLRDPNGTILVDVPRGAVTLRSGVHRVSTRGGSFPVPTLELRGPGRALLRLGVWDSRFASDERAAKMAAPRYLVGAPDWEALLEALGSAEGATGMLVGLSA
ncbi:MAG: hypothetical protein H5U40_06260, partial [Polyangiaceae bacterium]|nr:hypothetical protein [Polyangiaceae bacterium]